MAIRTRAAILTAINNFVTELNAKIRNDREVTPETVNNIFTLLSNVVRDINDSARNLLNSLDINSIQGLGNALNLKQDADATLLNEADVVNNAISDVTNKPVSAAIAKQINDRVSALPGPNVDTALNQGGANQVTAAQIKAHLADASRHFTQQEINHDLIQGNGINSHALIDAHIANPDIHLEPSQIDHTLLINKGVNTHTDIDAFIANRSNPNVVTFTQAVTAENLGVTKGSVFVANGTSLVRQAPGQAGTVLKANPATATGVEWAADAGEVNALSSVGAGASLVDVKSGTTLQVRSISSTDNKLQVSVNGQVVEFTLQEANIEHDTLSGSGQNDHATIDAHIAATGNVHGATLNDFTVANAKGDLLAYTGVAHVKLAAGTNGQVLVSDSTAASGLAWSSNLTTATAHVNTVSGNPHSVTLTEGADAEGLTMNKGTVYTGNGTNIVATAPGANGQVLTFDSTAPSGVSATTIDRVTGGSNRGVGEEIFDARTGDNLVFKTLTSTGGSINFTSSADSLDLAINVSKADVGLANVPNVDTRDADNHVSGGTNKVFTAAEQAKLGTCTANPEQAAIADLPGGGTTADLETKVNDILAKLRLANIIST